MCLCAVLIRLIHTIIQIARGCVGKKTTRDNYFESMTLGEGADYPDIVKRDVIVVADFINANVQSGSV